jgi:hypothetical protein
MHTQNMVVKTVVKTRYPIKRELVSRGTLGEGGHLALELLDRRLELVCLPGYADDIFE